MRDKTLISPKCTRDLQQFQMTDLLHRCIVGTMQKTSDVIWQDTQHQVLFRLLDEVAETDSAAEVLRQLRYYAESHFALEERYMSLLDYPGKEEHVAAHDKFRSELRQMFEGGEHDAASRQLISTFLTEWLKRHVFGIDKKLEEFLLANNVH